MSLRILYYLLFQGIQQGSYQNTSSYQNYPQDQYIRPQGNTLSQQGEFNQPYSPRSHYPPYVPDVDRWGKNSRRYFLPSHFYFYNIRYLPISLLRTGDIPVVTCHRITLLDKTYTTDTRAVSSQLLILPTRHRTRGATAIRRDRKLIQLPYNNRLRLANPPHPHSPHQMHHRTPVHRIIIDKNK